MGLTMLNQQPHAYMVISPEYETYSFNGIDPPEYGCDAVQIECDSPSDAKALALRTDEFKKWMHEARMNQQSPYAGLRVEPCICDHGVCGCSKCPDCSTCKEEYGL